MRGKSYVKWLLIAVNFVFCFICLKLSGAQQPLGAAKTNVPPLQPVEVVIPKSVFIYNPKEPGYGRDPFFPVAQSGAKPLIQPTNQQESIKPVEITKKPEPPPKPVVDLKLQGIAGTSRCVINGKPIAVGEEELIPYSGGKIRIRCNKIKGETVSVTIFFDDGSTEDRDLVIKGQG